MCLLVTVLHLLVCHPDGSCLCLWPLEMMVRDPARLNLRGEPTGVSTTQMLSGFWESCLTYISVTKYI